MRQAIKERFLRYAEIVTMSCSNDADIKTPSTSGQQDLLNLLRREMEGMGIIDIYSDEKGYLIGRIPPSDTGNVNRDYIGFMAHVDTSEDVVSEIIKPVCHENYNGSAIKLESGIMISPEEETELRNYLNDTIITSDGNSLLGADDKAGVAEIMETARHILNCYNKPHCGIELIFTPDEETGMGMNHFPLRELKSKFCYTVDGGSEGEIEAECYFAAAAEISFYGVSVHPGYGRGRLVNAVSMASSFIQMIPRSESPEATDGRYGNYWPHEISGRMAYSSLTVMLRDFEADGLNRRKKVLEKIAGAVEASYPGSKVEIFFKDQYRNMKETLDKNPQVLEILRQAVTLSGVKLKERIIRGGTDGARLTEMGIPTPNIFAGGHNFHSKKEWIALSSMENACRVLMNIIDIYSNNMDAFNNS